MLEDLGWLQPVLIAAAVVFVLDLIGNMISFSNRVLNALTTALVFAVLFGALIQAGLVKMDVRAIPSEAAAPAEMPMAPAETPAAPAEAPAAPAETPAAPAPAPSP